MQRLWVIDVDAAVHLSGLICFSWLLWFTSCFLSNPILDILWARSWVEFRAGTNLNFNLHRCSSYFAGKQQYSVFMLMALIWPLKWLRNSPIYRCLPDQSCARQPRHFRGSCTNLQAQFHVPTCKPDSAMGRLRWLQPFCLSLAGGSAAPIQKQRVWTLTTM